MPPSVSLTQEASVPQPTPTAPSLVTRVCRNLPIGPKRRGWSVLFFRNHADVVQLPDRFPQHHHLPSQKDGPSLTLGYNWPVTLTESREARVKPWEDAWKAIFSPYWVSIWSWLIRKPVHQGSHAQVQRRSRDMCLEEFMGSGPQVRGTSWLGPSVHPSKPSPVLTQRDKGTN